MTNKTQETLSLEEQVTFLRRRLKSLEFSMTKIANYTNMIDSQVDRIRDEWHDARTSFFPKSERNHD